MIAFSTPPNTIVYKGTIPYYFVSLYPNSQKDQVIIRAPGMKLEVCATEEISLLPTNVETIKLGDFEVPKPITPSNNTLVCTVDGFEFHYKATPESRENALKSHYFQSKEHAKAYIQAMQFIMGTE